MSFQNNIVRFLAFFIPVKDMREKFIKTYSRKTTYRKLRDDLLILQRELRELKRDIKGHIDLRLNSYFNAFFNYKDIRYNNPDLRTLQLAKNIMLLDVKKICEEDTINYWLEFGTLLGAVRNNGFIPWDDDIDLGMTRNDYEHFKIAVSKYSQLSTRMVFYKRGTSFAIVKRQFENFSIQFDIFIYDFINANDYEHTVSRLNESKATLVTKLNTINDPESTGEGIRFDFYDKNKKVIDEIFDNYLINCKICKENATHIANLTNVWRDYYFYEISSLFPLKKIIFEGSEHTVPNNTEEFLRVEFKYFMMLPNDTGKITHNSYLTHHQIKTLREYVDSHNQN